MKTIRIDNEVWEEISKMGKFGETPNDVLRRVFKLPYKVTGYKQQRTTDRMSVKVLGGKLTIKFQTGPTMSWPLPDRNDKQTIRELREQAIAFATKNMATYGQIEAVKKAFTQAGYHLTK